MTEGIKELLEVREGCEKCPNCHHCTLPLIRGSMTGRMCSRCKAIVDIDGNVEVQNHEYLKE